MTGQTKSQLYKAALAAQEEEKRVEECIEAILEEREKKKQHPRPKCKTVDTIIAQHRVGRRTVYYQMGGVKSKLEWAKKKCYKLSEEEEEVLAKHVQNMGDRAEGLEPVEI
jgi:hypothetical protein